MTRALAIAGVLAGFAPTPAAAQECPAVSVINCGHRGTGVDDPDNPFAENSIAAFDQGVLEGATMVELDVQRSSDGVLVVMHDDTVNRTTDGEGCVGDLTLAELQALDPVVPTFDEVLAAVDVDIDIEIKINEDSGCPDSNRAQLAADVAAAIAGDAKNRRLIVSSFDADVLSELAALDDSIYIGLLTLIPDDAQLAVDRGFDALNLFTITAREDAIADIHALGLDVNVWTENDPTAMQLLFEFGADMIITDDPDVFVAARTEFCDNYVPPEEDGGGCSVAARGAPPAGPLALLVLLVTARCRRRRSGPRRA